MNSLSRAIRALWHGLHLVEDAVLVALLSAMILLAVVKIGMRNFADSSIVWIDPFLSVSVLWVGLLGAMIAARDNSHIAIDIATRYLPEKFARASAALIAAFSAGICGLLAWHAGIFVRDEYSMGGAAFAQVPAWACEIILPIAFGLIALRYLLIARGVVLGERPVRKEGV